MPTSSSDTDADHPRRIAENERLRERCDYFDITRPLLSGQRLAVTVRWLERPISVVREDK